MNDTENYILILKETLIRKIKYMSELLKITQEQEKIIISGAFDEDAFEVTIDQKEILINNINESDKGFELLYNRVRKFLMENLEKNKENIDSMQQSIKQCIDLGVEIGVLEERNKKKLENVLTLYRKEIQQVKSSKIIAQNYYKSMSNSHVSDAALYDRKK